MPLTSSGKKVMAEMKTKYGKRGKEVFYASINKGVAGSSKWHKSLGKTVENTSGTIHLKSEKQPGGSGSNHPKNKAVESPTYRTTL